MRLEIVDSDTGLQALQDDWIGLERRAPCHVFQSFSFLRSWHSRTAAAHPVSLAVVTCRDDAGVLLALFPACVMTILPVRILTWLGGLFIVDYGDILADPAAAFTVDDFLEQSLSLLGSQVRYHFAYFPNVREDALSYPFFRRTFLPAADQRAPFLRINGPYEDYLDGLKRRKKHRLADTMRQMKRLRQLGTMTFRVLRPSDAEMGRVLQTFFEQKRKNYRAAGRPDLFEHPGYQAFYLDQATANGSAHVSCLLVGEDIAAIHVGYEYKDRLYYLMPSYDQRYAAYSPGRVLLYHLIEDSFARRRACFDFCLGGEEYKYDWTGDDIAEVTFASRSLIGRLFLSAVRFRSRVQGALRSFRR